jgi:predicted DNA-binding transcriptional regulator YafY
MYGASERQVREYIKQLRRAGHLIGSAPGADGGYYLITSIDEFNDFMRSEYLAKIKEMRETVNAMNHAAQEYFKSKPGQLRLI